MFQGHIDQDAAAPVEANAIPDVLFERGLYWASGRSGVVNLVAAHKWFNLAALKGRADAVPLRREVAELMSEVEIATAQREARAWMTAHWSSRGRRCLRRFERKSA
jgi:TPR repeat protein